MSNEQLCRKCKKVLSSDEIALSKKLINRATTVYYCIPCLADMFEVEQENLHAKVAYFKEIGCTLFD